MTYARDSLRLIGTKCQHDQCYRVMPFRSVTSIRSLDLNRRLGKLNKKPPRPVITRHGASLDNLVQVEIKHDDDTLHDTQMTIATLNIRSIKNKDQLVLRELNYTNADIVIVTESWLNNSEDNKLWIKSMDLNKDPYKCYSAPCTNGRGRGLMLICEKGIEVKDLRRRPVQRVQC